MTAPSRSSTRWSARVFRCRGAEDTFFTHRIVCDVCDILRFAAAPDDTERFLRIYYKFGAMISREAALAACAESARTHAPVLACLLAQGGLPDTCREAAEQLRARLDALPQTSGEALIRTIWGPMGYSRFVTERRLDPGKFSILCMLAAPQPSAAAFLARLDALRQLIRTHRDAPDARLTLSTIHGSKGLEYDRVFLLDVHDGVLPADPNGADGTEDAQRAYEEDRRLFYVAMTRAKNELYLFDYPDVPSAFVRELRQQLPKSLPPGGGLRLHPAGKRLRPALPPRRARRRTDPRAVRRRDARRVRRRRPLPAGRADAPRARPDTGRPDCSAVRAAPAAGGGRLRARQRDLAPEIRPRPHRVPAGARSPPSASKPPARPSPAPSASPPPSKTASLSFKADAPG